MIMSFARDQNLVLFMDFHGHSKKKNMFIYGCHDEK
jgi:hypothetical protein